MVQAEEVKRRLENALPGEFSYELVPLVTAGDKAKEQRLQDIGGKALFLKEIQHAVLTGKADIAVHSMKDIPAETEETLTIMAFLPREDARDVLISPFHGALDNLPEGAVIGTSSLRRQAQILHLRPDLHVIPFRGNVQTRLAKLEAREVDATILAAAGLHRLEMQEVITHYFTPEQMLPAIGQGAIGVECRTEDKDMQRVLSQINDPHTEITVRAERAFLKRLDGSCHSPIAAYATLEDNQLNLRGLIAKEDGTEIIQGSSDGTGDEAETMGAQLAESLLDQGGAGLLT